MSKNEQSKSIQGDKTKEHSDRWKATFTRYVNFTPTVEQKEEFGMWLEGKDLWTEIERLSDSGHRVSVEYDLFNSCYTASIFCKDKSSVNAGRVSTARGRTPEMAMWRVLWYSSDKFPLDWLGKVKHYDDDRW